MFLGPNRKHPCCGWARAPLPEQVSGPLPRRIHSHRSHLSRNTRALQPSAQPNHTRQTPPPQHVTVSQLPQPHRNSITTSDQSLILFMIHTRGRRGLLALHTKNLSLRVGARSHQTAHPRLCSLKSVRLRCAQRSATHTSGRSLAEAVDTYLCPQHIN